MGRQELFENLPELGAGGHPPMKADERQGPNLDVSLEGLDVYLRHQHSDHLRPHLAQTIWRPSSPAQLSQMG